MQLVESFADSPSSPHNRNPLAIRPCPPKVCRATTSKLAKVAAAAALERAEVPKTTWSKSKFEAWRSWPWKEAAAAWVDDESSLVLMPLQRMGHGRSRSLRRAFSRAVRHVAEGMSTPKEAGGPAHGR